MHIYQKNILDQLRINKSQKYSQLKPENVESSHFKYHLNQLIIDGLVEKQDRGVYRLTNKGKTAVDNLSRIGVNKKDQPKVITYTLIEDQDNYYLQKKDKEPYLGLLNMIGGKVHIGEQSIAAAKRELLEKANYSTNDLKSAGIAEIIIKSDNQIMSHVVAHIIITKLENTSTIDKTIKINKQQISNTPDLAPDTLDIIKAVENNEFPFWLNLEMDFEL